ncbi:MAG: hypothetical protein HY847_04050 [Betaproteobacteria bacterium]|nr:hypothetical protein [Betaproteobacteria bacterium]
MGLLDGFEKLINEHGSAAILKERIALANDKYAALEQKLSASELRIKELESENHGLRTNLEKAEIEIQQLKELSENAHGQRLPEIREKLLVLLATSVQYAPTVAAEFEVHEQVVLHHFEELEKLSMAEGWRVSGYDTEWHLQPEGRSYLVRHGLLA